MLHASADTMDPRHAAPETGKADDIVHDQLVRQLRSPGESGDRSSSGSSRYSFNSALARLGLGRATARPGAGAGPLQRKCACGGRCAHCRAAAAQAKLNVSQPGDPLELRADHAAETVMRMLAPGAVGQPLADGPGGGSHGGLPGGVANALSGSGKPMDAETRAFMEPRFGHSFAGVRIHTDSAAQEAATDLDARAFTVGSDIAFGAGEYNPHSNEGRHLLAHELAHTLQQAQGVQRMIQRQSIHNERYPCFETSLLPGGLNMFGTQVHLAVQQYYVSSIDPMAASEYTIPGSSLKGGTGRADIVSSIGGVYEIKPLGIWMQGLEEAENYVLHAEVHCDPKVNWHLGTVYYPRVFTINDRTVLTWLMTPGVIVYQHVKRRRQPETVPKRSKDEERKKAPARPGLEPAPAPAPAPGPGAQPMPAKSTLDMIKQFVEDVIANGLDAEEAAGKLLRAHPEIAAAIITLGFAGIFALLADDVTGAGVADDVAIPPILALMRVAWAFL